MTKTVVAFSGGLDSTTLLYHMATHAESVLPVFFDYGSTHGSWELAAAKAVLDHPAIPLVVRSLQQVQLPKEVFQGGKSALLNEREMPHTTYADLAQSKGPSPTVVPFRNAVIVSVCTAIAEAHGYDTVAIATHATDAREWAYPDCSPEFLGAMMASVFVGTYNKVRLIAPFMWETKADIVMKAAELAVPVHLTRSCYEDSQYACGACPTCVERIQAFRVCGYQDPITYTTLIGWYGCRPWPTWLKGAQHDSTPTF